MEKIKDLLFTFACVTTCVIFATALYISVFWQNEVVNGLLLWQILLVSFLCSTGTLWYPKTIKSKKQANWLFLLHYLYINLIVLGFGIFFEWFYVDDLSMVIGMLVLIAIIFLLMVRIVHTYDQKKADQLNRKLKDYIEKKHQ